MSASLIDFLRSVRQRGGKTVVDVGLAAHRMFDATGRAVDEASTTPAAAAVVANLPNITAELNALRAKFAAIGFDPIIAIHLPPTLHAPTPDVKPEPAHEAGTSE